MHRHGVDFFNNMHEHVILSINLDRLTFNLYRLMLYHLQFKKRVSYEREIKEWIYDSPIVTLCLL
jgi:hypothetical protein